MNSKGNDNSQDVRFSEILTPSFLTFVWAAILLPSSYLVFLPINETVGVIVGTALTLLVWLLMVIGSPRISVVDGQLWVGKAHILVNFLGESREIEAEFCFAERGPGLDARAFVRFQAGVKRLVRIELNDPEDPTPYWLLATRKPSQLLEAIDSYR